MAILGFIGINVNYKFFNDYLLFKKSGGQIEHLFPVLTDYTQQAGTASGHYFHQDLLVASYIHNRSPIRHIDVGSRIDGFVAHVASYRQIEVIDLRPLLISAHPNIKTIQEDFSNPSINMLEIADSISCLHALEHFGLGRYGDRIDPDGHLKGFRNLIEMLKPNGILYVSIPLGESNSVYFNAHRVFHPLDIFSWPTDRTTLELISFDYVDDLGSLHKNANPRNHLKISYGCGIYTFRKTI